MGVLADFQVVSSSLSQFELAQLDELLQQIIQLRAEKIDSETPKTEEELIRKIDEGLPEEIQARFKFLCQKQEDETITEEEHQELEKLIPITEQHTVRRLKYLMEYSKLTNIPFDEVLLKLDIKPQ